MLWVWLLLLPCWLVVERGCFPSLDLSLKRGFCRAPTPPLRIALPLEEFMAPLEEFRRAPEPPSLPSLLLLFF